MTARDESARILPPRPGVGPPGHGFTLVELMVVVVILGVLAAIAVPMFFSSSQESKRAALDQDLAIMNKAIEIYRVEHNGVYPGTLEGATTWDVFVKQMTGPTDKGGRPGPRYGPYLKTGIPKNPYTETNTGSVGKAIDHTGTLAWRYDPAAGEISAANDETGPSGHILDPDPEPIGD
jgi:type II secretion system protein G